MSASAYPLCASPLEVGPVTFKNRITRTAHGTGYAAEGKVTEQLIAYHEARARGGIGSVILETTGVHESAPGQLWGFSDAVVPGLEELCRRLHAHDVKVLAQLWHGGGQTKGGAAAPLAASALPDPIFGRMSEAMTKPLIDEMVGCFAAAAARLREAGLDGVEVHAGHSFLVSSFASPLTNRREDEYGGSLENRLRFAREILAAIRAACGPGFACGVRVSATDATEGGLVPAETRRMRELLEAEGLVDFVDVSIGGYYNLPKLIGAMHEPHGYELPTSRLVTDGAGVPTIVAGRINSLREAEEVLASGTASLVSMVRSLLADPDLVRKSLAGEEEAVRPCIGCNEGCIGRRFSKGAPIGKTGCAVNPDAGLEFRSAGIPRAAESRTVLVVGAGPAGLEAARTAALAGHRVAISEAASEPGGLVRIHRRAPYREEFGKICDWLWEELGRLEVERRLRAPVGAEAVLAEAPDEVIVATGSVPRTDGFQRLRPTHRVEGLERVRTPLEVLAGEVDVPAHALVFDDLGNYQAIGCAELMLERGAGVVFATSYAELAPDLFRSYQRDAVAARLSAHPGFELVPRSSVEAVGAGEATLRDVDSGRVRTVAAELVVMASGFEPRRQLFEELAARGVSARLAGDAAEPALIAKAIASGREAALAIGAANRDRELAASGAATNDEKG